ncbi:MAG TPA: CDP-alcohol phosphatidyltransferase family protein [Acidiferrobacteraceae bacterium]|nr:CDP-alcohol phosphatidyltransferase family protein [Acidiferrobacteraceae bacterium]
MPETSSSQSVFRTQEIEDPSNRYFIHPLSHEAAKLFARLGISPNTVSILGVPFGLAAAFLIFDYGSKLNVIAAFLLLGVWHVLDGADGQLARMTGKTSELGKIIDGICDYLVYISVYGAMALVLAQQWGPIAWVLALAAGLSHAFQGSLYEFYRYEYDHWVNDMSSRRVPTLAQARKEYQTQSGPKAILAWGHYVYVRAQYLGASGREELRQAMGQSLDRATPGEVVAIRTQYREFNLNAVRKWSILNSNKRTFAILVFNITVGPLYYFLFEVIVLNLAMVWCGLDQARRDGALLEELKRA